MCDTCCRADDNTAPSTPGAAIWHVAPRSRTWSLSISDELAVPNSRIFLAFLRCVRRLPGAFPVHSYKDLGALLAPLLDVPFVRRPAESATRRNAYSLAKRFSMNSLNSLHATFC